MAEAERQNLRLVLLAGLHRTGKTAVALQLRACGWDHIQRHEASDLPALVKAVTTSLGQSREVVVDSANLSAKERAEWIQGAKSAVPDLAPTVIICGQTPTGDEAAAVEPAQLQYREQWMSPAATAALGEDAAKERIHQVIKNLDASFDTPDTSEGIQTLTHVREAQELERVLAWLGPARQAAGSGGALGWATAPPASAQAAADAWLRVRQPQPSPPAPAQHTPMPHTVHGAPGAHTAAPTQHGQYPAYTAPMQQHAPQQQPALQSAHLQYAPPTQLQAPYQHAPVAGSAPQQQPYDASSGVPPHAQAPYAPQAQAPTNGGAGQSYHAPAAQHMYGADTSHAAAMHGAAPQPSPSYASSQSQYGGTPYSSEQQPFQGYAPHPGAQPAGSQPGMHAAPQHQPQAYQQPHPGSNQQASTAPGQVVPPHMQQYHGGMQHSSYGPQLQQSGELQPMPGAPPHMHAPPGLQAGMQPAATSQYGSGPQQPYKVHPERNGHAFSAGPPGMGFSQPNGHSGGTFHGSKRGYEDAHGAPGPHDAAKRGRSDVGLNLAPVRYDTADPRPILLFELSGVLCNSTKDRVASVTKAHLPRPGVAQLARLMPHFRLGVYTTSTARTVATALAVVASAVRGELASTPEGWRLLLDGSQPDVEADLTAALPWQRVFDESLVLSREQCEIGVNASNGRESTAKVVGKLFPGALHRVLVIDEASSTAPPESLVTVARWNGSSRNDGQLRALTDALLELALHRGASDDGHEARISPTADLRAIAGEASRACAAAPEGPRPVYRAVEGEQEGYFEDYPVKPGAEVCSFYVRCGYCKFADTCVKTHPLEYRVRLNKAGFPLRPGQPPCGPYMLDGFCQLIKACPHHHPNLRVLSAEEAAAEPPGGAGSQHPSAPTAVAHAAGQLPQHRGDGVVGGQRGTPEPSSAKAAAAATVFVGRPPPGVAQFQVVEEDWTVDLPQRPGAAVCEEFVKDGGCQGGSDCPHHHPLNANVFVPNNYGLPMRVNQPACEFFLRTGNCRFGVKCHKHHPHVLPGPASFGPPIVVPSVSNPPDSAMGPAAARPVPVMRPPDQQPPGGDGGRARPLIERRTDGAKFAVSADQSGSFPMFPVNFGAAPCSHFMRSGHCKFGPSCAHGHPPENRVLRNRDGLPMRLGNEICKFYLLNGACGYGPSCNKHHPNIERVDGPNGGPPGVTMPGGGLGYGAAGCFSALPMQAGSGIAMQGPPQPQMGPPGAGAQQMAPLQQPQAATWGAPAHAAPAQPGIAGVPGIPGLGGGFQPGL